MSAATPISRSKSAALSRVFDVVPRGYKNYTQGTVSAAKAPSLAKIFHHLYGIGLSPAKRFTKKKNGCANALLTIYWPESSEEVSWVLQVTPGDGMEREKLRRLDETPQLHFLGYELVRLATLGGKSPST